MSARQRKLPETPVLEWIAAGVGLVFLIALLGVIGAEALRGGLREAPAITVKVGPVARTGSGYVVGFEAVNTGGGTAAALQIEAKLLDHDLELETSLATVDYISAHGTADGGFFFSRDPAGLTIVARPLGYQTP